MLYSQHLFNECLRLEMAGMPKNVQKQKARPKRSIDAPGNDHELGLWVDLDLLRKHQSRTAQTVLHDPLTSINNRYLELADLALGNGRHKKTSIKGKAARQAHLEDLEWKRRVEQERKSEQVKARKAASAGKSD